MIERPDPNEFTQAARNLFISWLNAKVNDTPAVIFSEELRTMYCALVGSSISTDKFNKMLEHRDIAAARVHRNHENRLGFTIHWTSTRTHDDLTSTYLNDLVRRESSVANIPTFTTR